MKDWCWCFRYTQPHFDIILILLETHSNLYWHTWGFEYHRKVDYWPWWRYALSESGTSQWHIMSHSNTEKKVNRFSYDHIAPCLWCIFQWKGGGVALKTGRKCHLAVAWQQISYNSYCCLIVLHSERQWAEFHGPNANARHNSLLYNTNTQRSGQDQDAISLLWSLRHSAHRV